MWYALFILRSALHDFRRNKVRTALTSLGILIGISSVILLLAFGLGLRRYIENQFESLGANLIMVTPGKLLRGGITSASGFLTAGMFDEKDVQTIKRVHNVKLVAPVYVKYTEVEGYGKSEVYELVASTPEIFPLLNFEVETGTLFYRSDVDSGNKVVVLGSKPAEKIFGSKESAIGKLAKMESQGFRVIGVLKAKGGGGFGEPGMDDHVFIPHKAALSFNPNKKFWGIYIKAEDESILDQTKTDIHEALLKRYHDDDFSVNDQKEFLNTFDAIFKMINGVLIGIAAISLVVGGVGIMNIMYVSVAERVQEIGIRRSYGATENDILFLFLSESVLLSLVGAAAGLVLSFGIVSLVQRVFPAYINIQTVILALGVSSVIGIVFGVLPAKRASTLTPVEAIRSE